MRVISGKSRGTKLNAPEGIETRPTVDRIKETLFNMITFDVPGCHFLDLFSGSGAIGIECLSRGAEKVVFVEKSPQAMACIRENLIKTHLLEEAILYPVDVVQAIDALEHKKETFDIIFLDPPYALEALETLLNKISSSTLLKESGYIILEHGTQYPLGELNNLKCIKQKKYKTTTLSFFERIGDA